MIKRPDFIEFVLEDTHSRVLRDYINDLEERIDKSINYINYYLKHGHTKNWKQLEYSLLEILDKGVDKE